MTAMLTATGGSGRHAPPNHAGLAAHFRLHSPGRLFTGGLCVSTARQGQNRTRLDPQAPTYRDGLQLMTRHYQPGTGHLADPAT